MDFLIPAYSAHIDYERAIFVTKITLIEHKSVHINNRKDSSSPYVLTSSKKAVSTPREAVFCCRTQYSGRVPYYDTMNSG